MVGLKNFEGDPTKSLNPTTYGCFFDMYIWLTTPTFTFNDWNLEVVWSFIDALTMMVNGRSWLSSFWSHELISGSILLLLIPFDGMFMVELIWVLTYPSKVFQVVYPCLPFSPFQWTFLPFEGFQFLTFLKRLFKRLVF